MPHQNHQNLSSPIAWQTKRTTCMNNRCRWVQCNRTFLILLIAEAHRGLNSQYRTMRPNIDGKGLTLGGHILTHEFLFFLKEKKWGLH